METTYGLVKIFRASSGYYVYDGATGRILTVAPQLIHESETTTEAAVLRYLLARRMVSGSPLPDILWEYDFPRYLEMLEDQIPALLLQITRRCNLNCDYCVYSGNYAHMEPHANQDMTEDILCRSIDFFAAHSGGRSQVTVDFYGGEALLCFRRVQEAIQYAKQVMPDRAILFRATSNGVLLDEHIAQFLKEHPEMRVLVTVNGPYHDRHRRDWAGNGSLGRIMDNLRRLREDFPDVWEHQIHFIANVAHGNHLPAVVDFYRREIGKPPDVITRIRGTDANEIVDRLLSEKTGTEIEDGLRRSYCESGDPFLEPCFGQPVRAARERRIAADGAPGVIGSCMPPLQKLFVLADGSFGVCETCCDKVRIGDLEHGFDKEKLRRIYDGARRLFQSQCRTCWAQRLCTVCLKDVFESNGSLAERVSGGFCRDSRRYVLEQLRMYCEIADTHPERIGAQHS